MKEIVSVTGLEMVFRRATYWRRGVEFAYLGVPRRSQSANECGFSLNDRKKKKANQSSDSSTIKRTTNIRSVVFLLFPSLHIGPRAQFILAQPIVVDFSCFRFADISLSWRFLRSPSRNHRGPSPSLSPQSSTTHTHNTHHG